MTFPGSEIRPTESLLQDPILREKQPGDKRCCLIPYCILAPSARIALAESRKMFAWEGRNSFSQPGPEPALAALLGLKAAPEANLQNVDKHPELYRTPPSAHLTTRWAHLFIFCCKTCHDVSFPGTLPSRASPWRRAGERWVKEWLECVCCSTVFCSAIACRFLSDCRGKKKTKQASFNTAGSKCS